MKTLKIALGVFTAALTAAAMQTAFAEALEVSGATTVQKRILEPGAQALAAKTGVELKIYGPGTGKGLVALIDGKVPVAAAGESLEDSIESAKKAVATASPSNRLAMQRLHVTLLAEAKQFDAAQNLCQDLLKTYKQPGEIVQIRMALSGVYSMQRNFPKAMWLV